MDYSFKPTTNGRAALAACMALGNPPDICRVAFGSGRISETANLADQHELLEFVADGTIGNRRHKDDHFYFTIQYLNSAHPDVKTFYLSEFIVYIKDPETGGETDLLYGTLGDYSLPVPQYHETNPPSVFDLPLALVVSDEVEVKISAPPGLVTYDDLQEAVAQALGEAAGGSGNLLTEADKAVPGGLATLDEDGLVPEAQLRYTRYVAATRPRDPDKPAYGLGGGGDDGGDQSVALKVGQYTGTADIAAVVSGVTYDAKNLGFDGEDNPDGTIIIKTEE